MDDALDLLTAAREHSQEDAAQTAVVALQHLTHVAPARVQAVPADVGEQEATVHDLRLLCGLARTARDKAEPASAYSSAVRHARATLSRANPGMQRWAEMVKFFFATHAQQADKTGACATAAQALHTLPAAARGDAAVRGVLACELRDALAARQQHPPGALYELLSDRDAAVGAALDVDAALAEATLAAAGGTGELWQRVAARGDALAVASSIGGVLAVHDVLDAMLPFEAASERVKAAVVAALRDHRRVALAAAADARATLAATQRLRADAERVRAWPRCPAATARDGARRSSKSSTAPSTTASNRRALTHYFTGIATSDGYSTVHQCITRARA